MTSGTLTWTFQPIGAGLPVVVTTECSSRYAPYSFLVEVPCESALPGLVISGDVLALASPPLTYNESGVQLNGQTLYLKHPSQALLPITTTNRGALVEVDLTLLQSDQDTDGSGLFDSGQSRESGHFRVDPNPNADHEGMTNPLEHSAGAHASKSSSTFALLSVTPGAAGSWVASWISVTNRSYTLYRSTNLQAGFQVVAAGIPSAGAVTQFEDTPPPGSPTCFYKVSVP